ncbi:MAG: hypothetical protein U0575_16010 [Phycisphaerales bacterium]
MASAQPPATTIFADRLRAVLLGVRGALTEALLDAGTSPDDPQDIAKRLGLHRNLAWKVSRVATEREVFLTLDHLPGTPGCASIVAAIDRCARRPASVARLREALKQFDDFVDEQAGDRPTLQLMLIELLPRHAARERQELARRAAYDGNRAVWGVQMRLRCATTIVAPSAGGDTVDVGFLGGAFGLAPLRSTITMPVFRMAHVQDDGKPAPQQPRAIVDPPPADGGMPILRDFCSANLPPMTVLQREGATVYQVPLDRLGSPHEVDCVSATITREAHPLHASPENPEARHVIGCMSPAEMFMWDMLVARTLPFELPPITGLASALPGTNHNEPTGLPLYEDLERLGSPPTIATPLWARYPEAVGFVLDRLGWNLGDFVGFRLTIPVPPMPARFTLRYPLAPR